MDRKKTKKGKEKPKKPAYIPPSYNTVYGIMLHVITIHMPSGCRYSITTNDFLSYYISDDDEGPIPYHQLAKLLVDKRRCYEHIGSLKKTLSKLIGGIMFLNRLVRLDDVTPDSSQYMKLMLMRFYPRPCYLDGIAGKLPRHPVDEREALL